MASCLRRRHHLVEHPVNPVADLELVLERLEVDVGGLVADGDEEHVVEQLPHGRGVGHFLEGLQVNGFARVVHRLGHGAVVEFGEEALDRLLDSGVVAVERARHGRLVAHRAVGLAVEEEPQVVERLHVERVGHRDGQDVVLELGRDDAIDRGDRGRDAGDHVVGDFQHVEVHDLHPGLDAEGGEHLLLGHVVQADEDGADGAAALLLGGERLLDLGLGDEAHLLEDLADELAAADLGRLGDFARPDRRGAPGELGGRCAGPPAASFGISFGSSAMSPIASQSSSRSGGTGYRAYFFSADLFAAAAAAAAAARSGLAACRPWPPPRRRRSRPLRRASPAAALRVSAPFPPGCGSGSSPLRG